MALRLIEQDADVVEAEAEVPEGRIVVVARIKVVGDEIVLYNLHIDGPGTGTLGVWRSGGWSTRCWSAMMSRASWSTASAARRVQLLDVFRPRSGSAGVVVRVSGWRAGFNKVGFTRLLRDGGYRLSEAATITGSVLDGASADIRLMQFDSTDDACHALEQLGLAGVQLVEPVGP